MAYISKIKLQDSVYEIIADKNTEKKTLATEEYVADAVVTKEEKIYKQNDEPIDAPDGAIWIDLDAESSSGGGSAVIDVDTSLTVSGMAADSKTVGDALSELNTLVGNTVTLDGSKAMTGTLQMGGNKITGVAYPTSATDVATKEFVETFSAEGNTYVATDDNDDGNVVIRPYAADVDDVTFLGHIVDKNNPHGVTAAQAGARPDTWLPTIAEIGAAPSGYGYGGKITTKIYNTDGTEADFLAKLEAVYASMSDETAMQVQFVDTSMGTGFTFTGTLYKNWSEYGWLKGTTYNGATVQRHKVNGVWSYPEWENPHMYPHDEYATTERYQGQRVYRKLIPYYVNGSVGSTMINIPHGIENFGQAVRVIGFAGARQFPIIFDLTELTTAYNVDTENIVVRCKNSDTGAGYWYFDLAYTKTV